MRRPWTSTAVAFLVLALLGLIRSGICTVLVVVQRRDVLSDIAAGGPFVTSISVDLGVAAVAGVVLMVVEGRRLGMRRIRVSVVLAGVTALAFAFPLSSATASGCWRVAGWRRSVPGTTGGRRFAL